MFYPELRLDCARLPAAVCLQPARNHVTGNPQYQFATAASMQSNMRFCGYLKVKRPRAKTIGRPWEAVIG